MSTRAHAALMRYQTSMATSLGRAPSINQQSTSRVERGAASRVERGAASRVTAAAAQSAASRLFLLNTAESAEPAESVPLHSAESVNEAIVCNSLVAARSLGFLPPRVISGARDPEGQGRPYRPASRERAALSTTWTGARRGGGAGGIPGCRRTSPGCRRTSPGCRYPASPRLPPHPGCRSQSSPSVRR